MNKITNKKIALVVPTIRILNSWKSYAENFKNYNHNTNNIKLIVVDDFCPYIKENIELLKECNIPFEFWTVEMQEKFFQEHFGSQWEEYWEAIPHHTDACRSFGYLIAGLWGADVIITWDDDNWAINDKIDSQFDYLSAHSIVNQYLECTEISSDKGWFNTCSMLETSSGNLLYPRGYPYPKRGERYQESTGKDKIVMNVGLWTVNPDVDAITVLNEGSMNGLPKTQTIGLRTYDRIMLAKNTFAPLNTANTAYSKDLLPCMYDTFQGAKVGELKLDRYGDIWCNFFVKKILDAVGGRVLIGTPVVAHNREPRDTMVDFQKEFWGMIVSERVFEIVESIELNSTDYFNAYNELINKLSSKKIYPAIPSIEEYFRKLFKNMKKWLEILDKLGIS